MSDIKDPPTGGQDSVLNWSDPDVARAWLLGLRAAIADVKSVTEDQQRPRRQRSLGPREAERITREAFTTLEKALTYAERGLPPPPFTL